ncbi:hypothetical protein TRFO_22171 [Tritrichomonas foetus]|uniref:Uncharacterized protein n=1 Tax=Tritrichomonas foetus TaxID=1144522 RepID=A0A1J4KC80_9EUKA|nr:hypothetical protein TRFO_22171 [Tritrichomonas foetus]|eukprot:OHT09023.1 hypothetical protein TRFO_22171 [Tritrichomonas foetus]
MISLIYFNTFMIFTKNLTICDMMDDAFALLPFLFILYFLTTRKKVTFPKLTGDYYYFPDVYIGVIEVTCNSPRTPALMKSWGNRFLEIFPSSSLKVVTFNKKTPYLLNNNKLFADYYLNISSKEKINYRIVFDLNYLSAQDFYDNTNIGWYIRTTYDCFIHLNNFQKMMRNLSLYYNPYKDVVMKGSYEDTFIHGGSGWILSRAAVQLYLRKRDKLERKYRQEPYGDDVNILHFVHLAHLMYNEVNDPRFVGWPVTDESYEEVIKNGFFSIQKTCDQNYSRKPPVTLNEVIFWHNGRQKNYVFPYGEKYINYAPSDIAIQFTVQHGSEFCRLLK